VTEPGATPPTRLLVVDRDGARAAALARAARGHFGEVAIADQGEAGWRRLLELAPTDVLAAVGGELDGAWLARRIRAEEVVPLPRCLVYGEPEAIAALPIGLELDGVLELPVARAALASLARAAAPPPLAHQVARLRDLFGLSLMGPEGRNLGALLARAAAAFQVADCAVWIGSEIRTAIASDVERRAELLDACRVAGRAGATLFRAPAIGDGPVSDADGTSIAAALVGAGDGEGVALIAPPGRGLAADDRGALLAFGQRLHGELAWMMAHERLLTDNERLRDAALLDPLFGVMNHTAFEQAVRAQLSAADRSGQPLVLAILDVAGMRSLNERFGHQVGDRVLAHVARLVRSNVRSSDPIGRVGGDELGVLFVGIDVERARAAVGKLLAALAAAPYQDAAVEIPVAMTCGLAPIGESARNTDAAFERARAALRRARPGTPLQVAPDDGTPAEADGPAQVTALPPGTLLGGLYRVLHELSRGAMGVVYRAEDLGLGRQIAIKLLRADLARDADLVARFRREAGVLAALRHQNLVQVYALGADQDEVYFVMELVEGEPLSDLLIRLARARERIELEAVARIVEQIADALDAIHAAGIVHRDVKPANVLIDHVNDRAVLVDVGVARRRDEAVDAAGTPGYAAPECFLDMAETPATDVYGLAATAYAMLTGRPPYEGGDLGELVARQMNQLARPPSSLRPGLPTAVDAVLAKALAAKEKDRFGSAPSFAVALSRALAREPGPSVRSQPPQPPTGPHPTTGSHSPLQGTFAKAPVVARCRAAFFKVAGRLIERELGARALGRVAGRDAVLGPALAASTPSNAWLALDDLERLLAAAGELGVDAAALGQRVGRATISATLARHLGADPASLTPLVLLRTAESFWSRYHEWGGLAVDDTAAGVRATVSTPSSPLICAVVEGMLGRIPELAGATEVTVVHEHDAAPCAYELSWTAPQPR
jgi:diguanylate cyclase (GGDEF)-like protein